MNGSLDDIADILELLDKTGYAYALMIGRSGDRSTRVWSNGELFKDEANKDGDDVFNHAWNDYMKNVRGKGNGE